MFGKNKFGDKGYQMKENYKADELFSLTLSVYQVQLLILDQW